MVSSNDVMRLYLQGVMSRRLLSEKAARKLWEKCVDAVRAVGGTIDVPYANDNNSWNAWVNKINDALNPLDLEFGHAHDEHSGTHVYGIVNRRGDDAVAQMATEYSAAEIAFFKAIDQTMLAPNESYCVSSLVALREVNFIQPTITKTHAEKVLTSLVSRGWLVRSKKGRYSLSSRTILELQSYLRQNFGEDKIRECTICFEMVTTGFACTTVNCKTRLHTHCYVLYRKRHNSCPSCNSPWSSDVDGPGAKMGKVGEAAFKDGQDKIARKTRKSSANEDNEEGEGEEEADEGGDVDDAEANPSQPPATQEKRGKGKLKRKSGGKQRAVIDDEDDDEMDVDEEQGNDEEEEMTQPKRKGRR